MSRPSLLIVSLCTFFVIQRTCAVRLEEGVDDYVKQLIEEFERNPLDARYDHVIKPPWRCSGALLPKVFLWCPMQHFSVAVKCPKHGNSLEKGQWTDPRMIYDLYGNVLLVQRFYVCRRGIYHRYLSASAEVMRCLPSPEAEWFQIRLHHLSGWTQELVDFVNTQVVQGVNFLQICEVMASLNYHEYCKRSKYISDCQRFHDANMFSFPSNDKIMHLFLAEFQVKKPQYEREMSTKLSARIISCDHTFKVSKSIGAFRDCDGQFVEQFQNLFIILNEHKQVLAWRLTRTTAFKEIEDLLTNLHERYPDLEEIYVDDCCHVRKQYEGIFQNVAVRLDLFHAVQRVVRTIPKGTVVSSTFGKEFGLVFRDDGDLGPTRQKATPDPAKLESNLNTFVTKWKTVMEELPRTGQEVDNLLIHIRKGCLSGIQPGQGTEANENLHRYINRCLLVGSTTIGPELAIAVLTILFYTVNCKKVGEKHSSNSRIVPVEPIENQQGKSNEQLKDFHMKTSNRSSWPDGRWQKSNANNCQNVQNVGGTILVNTDNIEEICNDENILGTLMKQTHQLLNVLTKIGENLNNRAVDVFDMSFFQLGATLLTPLETAEQNEHCEMLNRNLSAFNLACDDVPADGDCAFVSIMTELHKCVRSPVFEEEQYLEHLKFLDLGMEEIKADAYKLRQLFVDRVQLEPDYLGLIGLPQEAALQETECFRQPGTFTGNVGDIVVKVCANILEVSIVVITSIPGSPYLPFIPENVRLSSPLFLAFNASGPGHYNGTKEAADDEIPGSSSISPNCTCGKNAKDAKKMACTKEAGTRCPCVKEGNSCTRACRCRNCGNAAKQVHSKSVNQGKACRCGHNAAIKNPEYISCKDGVRKSKCPCLASGQGCGNLCLCINCGNGYGAKESKPQSPSTHKRKRETAVSYKRQKSSTFLHNVGFDIVSGSWTHFEAALLLQVVSFLSLVSVSPSTENVKMLFNSAIQYSVALDLGIPATCKTLSQIAGKLQLIKKKQDLAAVLNN